MALRNLVSFGVGADKTILAYAAVMIAGVGGTAAGMFFAANLALSAGRDLSSYSFVSRLKAESYAVDKLGTQHVVGVLFDAAGGAFAEGAEVDLRQAFAALRSDIIDAAQRDQRAIDSLQQANASGGSLRNEAAVPDREGAPVATSQAPTSGPTSVAGASTPIESDVLSATPASETPPPSGSGATPVAGAQSTPAVVAPPAPPPPAATEAPTPVAVATPTPAPLATATATNVPAAQEENPVATVAPEIPVDVVVLPPTPVAVAATPTVIVIGGGGSSAPDGNVTQIGTNFPGVSFIALSGMAPGDQVVKTIGISNSGDRRVNTGLTTVASGGTSALFSSPNGLRMQVWRVSPSALLYDGPIQVTNLSLQAVLLPGAGDQLEIRVSLSPSADNAFQNLAQNITFIWGADSGAFP